MSLSQVQMAVAIVVGLIATWSAMLIGISLLLPNQVGKSEYILETETKSCFWKGLIMLLVLAFSFLLLYLPLPITKILGQVVLMLYFATLVVGSAGLAKLMGRRMSEMSGSRNSFANLVQGTIVYSLAMGFPYFGWFLFAPLTALYATGAGMQALWTKRRAVISRIDSVTPIEN